MDPRNIHTLEHQTLNNMNIGGTLLYRAIEVALFATIRDVWYGTTNTWSDLQINKHDKPERDE